MQLPRARVKESLSVLFKETFYEKTISWPRIVAVLEIVTIIIAHDVGHLTLLNDLKEYFESTPVNKSGGTVNNWIENNGGWLDKCCDQDKKPPKTTAHRCGQCINCGKFWCRISKSCKASFTSLKDFLDHEKQTKHTDITTYVAECSYCGERKIRTKPLFGQCPAPCLRLYCTHEGCDKEFNVDMNVIKVHYQMDHEETLYAKVLRKTKQTKQPIVAGQPWTGVCCGKNNKPLSLSASPLYGECQECGEVWCRMDKSCDVHFETVAMMNIHQSKDPHSNPTPFKDECSHCEKAKDRSLPLFGLCHPPCVRGYCTHKNCIQEFADPSVSNILVHYNKKHPNILENCEYETSAEEDEQSMMQQSQTSQSVDSQYDDQERNAEEDGQSIMQQSQTNESVGIQHDDQEINIEEDRQSTMQQSQTNESVGGQGTKCCSKDKKPLRGPSCPFYGRCRVCQRHWCRIDKSCKANYKKLKRMLTHQANDPHSNPTSFIHECSYCEGAKDRSLEFFGLCPSPCQRGYCTYEGCDSEMNKINLSIITNHYHIAHEQNLGFQQFKRQVEIIVRKRPAEMEVVQLSDEDPEEEQNHDDQERNTEQDEESLKQQSQTNEGVGGQGTNCCSRYKKPLPAPTSPFYGLCKVCKRHWCRINKSCNANYKKLKSMLSHQARESHSNAISFIRECSHCEGAKDRSLEFFGRCPSPCQRGYCTQKGCHKEMIGPHFSNLSTHYYAAHKKSLRFKQFREQLEIINKRRLAQMEVAQLSGEDTEEEQNEEDDNNQD